MVQVSVKEVCGLYAYCSGICDSVLRVSCFPKLDSRVRKMADKTKSSRWIMIGVVLLLAAAIPASIFLFGWVWVCLSEMIF